MKIAIKANPSRGKEIISLLKSLGGNSTSLSGDGMNYSYYIDENHVIRYGDPPINYKVYTLEEFEKEFPFKVGDKVIDYEGDIAIITGFAHIEEKLGYSLQYENGRGTATPRMLKPYKEMKEERNITLTLNKAKEWYNKGGELKEIALQAFTEKELTKTDLPKTWKEFFENYPVQAGECWLGSCDQILKNDSQEERTFKNWISSKKSAEAHLAMIQLEQLKNCWWNGWKPEWKNCEKYVIKWEKDNLIVFTAKCVHAFLVFPTREMAEEFLECFKDLIEQAGDLI